jgi:hypothetical protein
LPKGKNLRCVHAASLKAGMMEEAASGLNREGDSTDAQRKGGRSTATPLKR